MSRKGVNGTEIGSGEHSFRNSHCARGEVKEHNTTHKDIVCERKTISDFIVHETRWKEEQQTSEK